MDSTTRQLLERAHALRGSRTLERIDAWVHHEDPGDYWAAVERVHATSDADVIEQARAWCASADPEERWLAADVLCWLGGRGNDPSPFRERSIPIVSALLADDDERVLCAALGALELLEAKEAAASIAALATHGDETVRHRVVHALLCNEDPIAVDTLIRLSRDPCSDVRDWATFGLGDQLGRDTPAIRDALAARLGDEDADTHSEAYLGLALRRDPRALPVVRAELGSDDVSNLAVQAARELGAPELLPLLEDLRPWWTVDVELLEEAIANCSRRS